MNEIIEKFIRNISLDERISDGVFNVEDEKHMDVLQEKLKDMGLDEEESLHYRNKIVEGRFPERQAYNSNGILVTFPTPEYKQRALKRGTHFDKNPRKGKSNLTFDDAPTAAPEPKPEPKEEPKPEPKEEPKEKKPEKEPVVVAPEPPPEPPKPVVPPAQSTLPVLVLPPGELKKREDAEVKIAQGEYVEKLLTTDGVLKYTLEEARRSNFYTSNGKWYSADGKFVGIAIFDERTNSCYIA